MDKPTAQSLIAPRWPSSAVASTAMLRAAGIDDRMLTRAVELGIIVRLRRGAYIPTHRWQALAPWEKDEARIDAHVAATGAAAVYCLSSAAILHGCDVWNTGAAVHVATGYSGSQASRAADTQSHRLGLIDADVVVVVRGGRELRVTSLARTVADCSRYLQHEQAVIIGDSALHRGLAKDSVVKVLEFGTARGRRRARAVLDALEPATESPGESRLRLLLGRLGFDRLVVQLRLMTPEGIYRADFAWVELKIIIEFDGESKYLDKEPAATVLLAERRRETLLMEQGWIFVRFRWADLERPDEVRRRVESAIARATVRTA